MLDVETKRKIDNCRDILVGKIPDPKSQVEQITIALIYKFMDDMDQLSVYQGGKPSFFRGEFEKYSWSSIFDPRIDGFQLLNLYGEALLKMNQNPNIPQLFRDIFKNAFLPYRDPETLRLFLKEISGFSYDHSEKLGDAFEYLLSVLGSQGEAGQFRTPRHIIDFIVEVVAPHLNETVLDPACGTAGFLISAYKHITRNNPKLSNTQKQRLMGNFVGYDIDPGMRRLSLVNMYLHGFPQPHIDEYDTLTYEDHWQDNFDIIMTNPPFMTPKGGIRPHKRFSIKTKRSEALFVDYLIEHLNINGKAGIIVPDGIVNNKSFTNLRKIIIENGLYAVVSLHEYVFKPYAGAKTCILFFDKSLKSNPGNILFSEIDDDGFSKGAQRLKIEKDDLPELTRLLKDFKKQSKSPLLDLKKYNINASIINLNALDENVYYHYKKQLTLFPNTYIYKNSVAIGSRKAVRIYDVFSIKKGTLQSTKAVPGEYRFITASDEYLTHEEFTHNTEALIIAVAAGGSLGKVQYVHGKFIVSDLCFILTPKKKSKSDLLFYLYYFKGIKTQLVRLLSKGVSKPSINKTDFENLLIDDFNTDQQKQIGDIIRSTREKISEHEKKIHILEEELIVSINSIRQSK